MGRANVERLSVHADRPSVRKKKNALVTCQCLDSSARRTDSRRTRGADAADGITTVRDRCASRGRRSTRAPRAATGRVGPSGLAAGRPPPTHGSTYTRMLQPVTIGTMEITALASPTASSSMFKYKWYKCSPARLTAAKAMVHVLGKATGAR